MPVLFNSAIPISLGEVMGSVMTSLVDAQAQGARATVEFINDIGFSAAIEGEEDTLRMVDYNFQKRNENEELVDFKASIPLLSLVDIPQIAVTKATIDFSYEISETVESVETSDSSNDSSSSFGFYRSPFANNFKGTVSKKTNSSSTTNTNTQESANLSVKVEVEKAAAPAGLERLLDILEVAIQENPVSTTTTTT